MFSGNVDVNFDFVVLGPIKFPNNRLNRLVPPPPFPPPRLRMSRQISTINFFLSFILKFLLFRSPNRRRPYFFGWEKFGRWATALRKNRSLKSDTSRGTLRCREVWLGGGRVQKCQVWFVITYCCWVPRMLSYRSPSYLNLLILYWKQWEFWNPCHAWFQKWNKSKKSYF